MKLIISPAKKMRVDVDTLTWEHLPRFLPQAELLYTKLQSMSYDELKRLWKCNDTITQLNVERLNSSNMRTGLTPAILSYEGIQYQHMAPTVFSQQEYNYIQEYLRILSGLYGMLRPFDGIIPYRLEMQAKLQVGGAKDLYGFWGDLIAQQLYSETDCIINLASKEYSQCISRHQRPGTRFITCIFGEEQEKKVVEKGTLCKMARGEMVRHLAEVGGDTPETLMSFSRLGFSFSPAHSDDCTYVFLRQRD